jgi:hypothetical protein
MNNFNLLMAAQFAFFNHHLAFGDAELFGEIFQAWPSTGGAVMATFTSSPCSPTIASRLAFG